MAHLGEIARSGSDFRGIRPHFFKKHSESVHLLPILGEQLEREEVKVAFSPCHLDDMNSFWSLAVCKS